MLPPRRQRPSAEIAACAVIKREAIDDFQQASTHSRRHILNDARASGAMVRAAKQKAGVSAGQFAASLDITRHRIVANAAYYTI